ncbi:hypothetical protein VE01_09039 [Pseudogymnoascus verrucosus]|uniref:C2H2-type domain-containing protein n=1 Tax=Pseudogymnoascus verrucosus TaxID=342668 RepID=A0A1B8GAH9_9PEZI|nr:uncharacterized protein VE01_09039 [Pseudogymnoascus verrucosus]OBT92855.2 hypothetical protein VE01_09039 [Pseudogymnoascus verrucosus]
MPPVALELGTSTASTASFACPQCQRSFSRRENLSRHLRTHRSINTHSCSICSKTFTRSDILKRHEALHLRNDDITNVAGESSGVSKRRKRGLTKTVINGSHLNTPPENHTAPSDAVLLREDHSPYVLQHGADNMTSHSIQTTHSDLTLSSSLEDTPTQPGLETSDATWRHVANLPFDFSFLDPPSPHVEGRSMDNWFTGEFYSALNETGIGWDDADTSLGQSSSTDRWNTSRARQKHSQHNNYQPTNGATHATRLARATPRNDPAVGHVSRAPSPPNVVSDEDGWPFAWNPRSSQVLRTELISIAGDDPLFLAHDPKYNISVNTYQAVIDWLDWTHDHRLAESSTPLNIPSLDVINLFIALFFRHYHPQMPVIHLATLVMDEDLPPALLASMVVIGATYSHQRHTRSFTIMLLDRVRRGLLMNTEYDHGLVREPMIIYAFLLVCHTGLWCGNKRSFELSQSLRGSVVNFCRRKGFGNDFPQTPILNQNNTGASSLEIQWREWVFDESQKRLCWAVFMLDCQFPTLLNLPSTISRGELSSLECPCDEEFWQAPSSRHWKRLLGPASVPPSISFTTALSSFIVPHIADVTGPGGLQNDRRDLQPELSPMKLNPSSQFIVLLAILSQLYEYSQEVVLAGKICGGDVSYDNRDANDDSTVTTEFHRDAANQMREMLSGPSETEGWAIWKHLAKRKMQLLESLNRWSETYNHYSKNIPRPSNALDHFQESSILLYNLGRLLLEIPLTDIQNAIGKSGPSKIPEAMSKVSNWVRMSPQSLDAALLCIEIIDSLAPVNHNSSADKHSTVRYSVHSIITVFLCHITLWAFINVARREQKQGLMHLIEINDKINSGHFTAVVKRGLIENSEDALNCMVSSSDASRLIFRSASEVLTRMSTWGAALDLAVLLYKRAEM